MRAGFMRLAAHLGVHCAAVRRRLKQIEQIIDQCGTARLDPASISDQPAPGENSDVCERLLQ
jgi:hypothetical protein